MTTSTLAISDEHVELAEAAFGQLRRAKTLAAARATTGSDSDSTAIWSAAAGLGWHGLAVDEQYGGSGLSPDDFRHLIDTTVTWAATPALSLMANYDYGKDRVYGTGVHWQGVAAYGRWQANSWLAFSPRFEWYDDHDGFTTGVPQTLHEFTFTSEHKISGSLLTRLEYRRDWSDVDYFYRAVDRNVSSQNTLTFGVVYAFSSFGK